MLAVGRYRYTAEYTEAETRRTRRFEGYLVLRHVTPERVLGTWLVDGFAADVQLGSYVEGAYRVNAEVQAASGTTGTFENLVSRAGTPAELRCVGRFVARKGDAVVSSPCSCTLTPVES